MSLLAFDIRCTAEEACSLRAANFAGKRCRYVSVIQTLCGFVSPSKLLKTMKEPQAEGEEVCT